MRLPRILDRFADNVPAPDLMPRTRARYQALEAARQAVLGETGAQHHGAVNISQAFPWAARDPRRTYTLDSGLHISLEDRWFICGIIGCGKTTLARELTDALARLYPMTTTYVLDSKSDGLFDDDPLATLFQGPDIPPVGEPGQRIIWQPGRDNIDDYSTWFENILFARRPCVVYVDEVSSLSRGTRHAEGYEKLIKLGRSLKQCVITLSQGTTGLPAPVRTQLMHLVRMHLEDVFDRSRADRMLWGDPKLGREPGHKYGLIHRRIGAGPAREYADWRELLT